jgi:protein-arginine kinase activator protein McsA
MKKHTPEELEEMFLDLISPQVFREKFEDEIKFKEYLNFRSIEELNTLMAKFVSQQMYEDACFIRDAINNYKLKKLIK